jgi:hypothetical protein
MKAKGITAGMQVVLPKFRKIKNCVFFVSRVEGRSVRLVNYVHMTECSVVEFSKYHADGRVFAEGLDAKKEFESLDT